MKIIKHRHSLSSRRVASMVCPHAQCVNPLNQSEPGSCDAPIATMVLELGTCTLTVDFSSVQMLPKPESIRNNCSSGRRAYHGRGHSLRARPRIPCEYCGKADSGCYSVASLSTCSPYVLKVAVLYGELRIITRQLEALREGQPTAEQ